MIEIITLSTQTHEEIVVITGDDPESAFKDADARDGRLKHKNKNKRKSLSN